MDNSLVKSTLNKLKKSKKLIKVMRNTHKYKFKFVDNYNKLTPYTYTILLKDTVVKTVINKKTENVNKLKRGDYVICGEQNEKYGLPLDKVINTYDLGIIENKKVIRNGFQLSKKNMKTNKNKFEIIPSWGGIQNMHLNDYILLEFNNKKYYGIEQKAFKKSYKKL
tara:strand:- start:361 stop:858 length:498 start_codon:yes stop_codon:yes gene_type:complete